MINVPLYIEICQGIEFVLPDYSSVVYQTIHAANEGQITPEKAGEELVLLMNSLVWVCQQIGEVDKMWLTCKPSRVQRLKLSINDINTTISRFYQDHGHPDYQAWTPFKV